MTKLFKKQMKIKAYILTFFILLSGMTFGQNWDAWEFQFKFKLNTEETLGYEYKNVEVFFNDTYTYKWFRDYELKFDNRTGEYLLYLDYGCISCGFPNSDFPPEIYLKINLEDDPHFSVPFSTIIPIYFQKSESYSNDDLNLLEYREREIYLGSKSMIDLGTIDIKHFITNYHLKDDIETFEIIEVESRKSIYHKKAGEYIPRRMNRLISLEVKNKN